MLSIMLYVSGIVLAVMLTCLGLYRHGTRPGVWHVLVSFFAATVLAFLFMCFTTILSLEGNPTRLMLLFWISSWLLLCFTQPTKRASLYCLSLFLLLVTLSWHHIFLAHSKSYTDNPSFRLRSARRANLARNRRLSNSTPPPKVIIRTVWHTWLTGLYEVHKT